MQLPVQVPRAVSQLFLQTEPWVQVPLCSLQPIFEPSLYHPCPVVEPCCKAVGLPSALGIHWGISRSRVLGCFEWLFWISTNNGHSCSSLGLAPKKSSYPWKPMSWLSPQSGHPRCSAALGCRMSRAAAFTWLDGSFCWGGRQKQRESLEQSSLYPPLALPQQQTSPTHSSSFPQPSC